MALNAAREGETLGPRKADRRHREDDEGREGQGRSRVREGEEWTHTLCTEATAMAMEGGSEGGGGEGLSIQGWEGKTQRRWEAMAQELGVM